MCLGVPMKIMKIDGKRAEVRSQQMVRVIGIELLKKVEVGDYVIVHAGFAIERLDPRRAKETLDIIKEMSL